MIGMSRSTAHQAAARRVSSVKGVGYNSRLIKTGVQWTESRSA